jgi:hypothetical protein
MKTWKISIKPASKKKFYPFERCRERSLVGIGWALAYEKRQPIDRKDAEELVKEAYAEEIAAWQTEMKKLFEDIKPGDHLWTHRGGQYYLCVAGDETPYYGNDICPDFLDCDLGHARGATWIKVPDELVLGSVQRGVIARRTIQPIYLGEAETRLNQHIEKNLRGNSDWLPTISLDVVKQRIAIDEQILFGIMSPDDVEDVVASKLQTEGWILLKSTCFRSKPKFEFQMIHCGSGKMGMVQVKSGSSDRLEPKEYKDRLTGNNEIFLFTTHRDPYPGEQFDDIHCILKQDVIHWMKNNPALLSYTLKLKLSLPL